LREGIEREIEEKNREEKLWDGKETKGAREKADLHRAM